MDKQKKQAIGQMILAAFMCAAVVIPGMVAVDAATRKEQAAQAAQIEQEKRAVAHKVDAIKAVATEPEKEPVLLSYYDSVPLDRELQNYIIYHSHERGIDPAIIMAMIDRESDYNADTVGDNGNSFGLCQIQPKWHYKRMQRLGCTDLFDPYQNVTVGIDYLCEQLSRYDGDIAKALVAYNQGSYNGTVTEYAKAVLEKADEIGGANVYELYR